MAQKDMRQAKATVMPLSKRYVTLERMQESLKGQKGQNSGHIGHMVSFPAPVLLHMSCLRGRERVKVSVCNIILIWICNV